MSLWERETGVAINLGKGHPKPSLLDVGAISEAMNTLASREGSAVQSMQYGALRGPQTMCVAACKMMKEWGRRRGISPERITVTSGASSAFGTVCSVFTKAGDIAVVEKPAYFLTYGTMRQYGLNIVEVSTDDRGINVDELEQKLNDGLRPSLLYTVTMCNNPRGTTLDNDRARRLVALSRQFNFKIAADEVYFFLQFDPKFARSLAEEDDEENPTVICMHSMSKILGPGIRVGWIDAHPSLVERLSQYGPIVSGGCTSHFMACVVAELINSGRQAQLLDSFRESYEMGAKAMTAALNEFLPKAMAGRSYKFGSPRGGYFLWLELCDGVDTDELVVLAEAKHKVFFFAGNAFCTDKSMSHCLRLCFAMLDPNSIREGVRRLCDAIAEYIQIHNNRLDGS
eukprot:Plantae.Rhodophyta-Purpureofilum_apyrenoidigerum.ctg4939.p1 GENE.Plantae.Rhodophyta-Purpureofilum_apyrenoidigerum.ctg4939~~Plantae.Rhodophyta-Purpureofilum_apyrenoidigerum.ctg4939.p1  ORF type:complete len:443 (-),score=59.79 Plantae.Rhodophyta-Purpureofilum_apyrenoidigerum.ctg4939:190-1386(-)